MGAVSVVDVALVGVPAVAGTLVLLAGLAGDRGEPAVTLAGAAMAACRFVLSVMVVSTPGRPEIGAPADGRPITEGSEATGATGAAGVTVPLAGVVDAGCC